jgi:hypothetical protein
MAIGGVAKYFAQRWDLGGYVAGLWRNYLAFQMMWKCQTPGVRPSQYHAPTWSWASIRGEIMPNLDSLGRKVNLLVEVGQVSIQYLTNNPYGEIVAAKLNVSGHLSLLTPEGMQSCELSNCSGIHGFRIESLGGRKSLSCDEAYLALDVEGLDPQLQTNLCFLPFVQFPLGAGTWYEGLVLQPTGNSVGECKRCGKLVIRDDASTLFPTPGFRQPFLPERFLNMEYESFDGELFTISIV